MPDRERQFADFVKGYAIRCYIALERERGAWSEIEKRILSAGYGYFVAYEPVEQIMFIYRYSNGYLQTEK